MSIIIIGKCIDCGKDVHDAAYARTMSGTKYFDANYRNFNDGKIKRCLECCDKKGIKKITLKTFEDERTARRRQYNG